jgi:hypothetical protein
MRHIVTSFVACLSEENPCLCQFVRHKSRTDKDSPVKDTSFLSRHLAAPLQGKVLNSSRLLLSPIAFTLGGKLEGEAEQMRLFPAVSV